MAEIVLNTFREQCPESFLDEQAATGVPVTEQWFLKPLRFALKGAGKLRWYHGYRDYYTRPLILKFRGRVFYYIKEFLNDNYGFT